MSVHAAPGPTEAALAEFDALLAEFPADADYLLGRAQMQARLGQSAAAAATLDRALALAPDYEDVWQLRLQLAQRANDESGARRSARAGSGTLSRRQRGGERSSGADRVSILGFGRLRRRPPLERCARLEPGVRARRLADCRRPGALFGEFSRSERFEETDSSLYVGGMWNLLPKWQLGAALAVDEGRPLLAGVSSFPRMRRAHGRMDGGLRSAFASATM